MIHSFRIGAAILSVLLVAAPAAAQTAPTVPAADDSLTDRIDVAAQAAMAGLRLPGMAVAVVQDGKIIYEKGFGVRNLSTKIPVQAQTQFEIGSITKQFTAAAVMQLVADGKISLNDPLSKYVPSYRPGRMVTIHQLLNQVSGIPDYTHVKHFEKMAPNTIPSFGRIMAIIASKPLEFAPGTAWRYSNTNYILLGRVIELASREPYTTYLFAHVIRPAGMTRTVTMGDESSLTDLATGYWPQKNGSLVPSPRFGAGWAGSAGYLVSDLDDLVAWDRAFFDGKIIPLRAVATATTPGKLKSGKATSYGFGWVIDTQGGRKRIWHNGGTFGFSSANLTYPEQRVEVIVLANTLASVESIGARLFEVLYPTSEKAAAGEDLQITARAREWLQRIQAGNVDRTQLTKKMSDAITPAMVSGLKEQLGPLGQPTSLLFKNKTVQGGSAAYTYRANFASISLDLILSIDAAGKIDGLWLKPAS